MFFVIKVQIRQCPVDYMDIEAIVNLEAVGGQGYRIWKSRNVTHPP
jgi:hypothetical protein